MRKIFLTATILLFSAAYIFAAGNTAALWQKGNELYKQKQYDSAAAYYEQIAAGKPRNALVYYNLGNAYYRQNKVGPAILNYQRALNADPTYKDAKDNLLLAEGRMSNHMQVVEDVFFVTWWNDLTAAARQKFWAIAALLVFIAMVGVMLANRLRPQGRKPLPPQVAGVLGFVWVCLMLLAAVSTQNSRESSYAVVMQNDAPLMNAEQKGKPLSLIPEGTTVRVKGSKGEYVEVSLPDGRVGWLQQSLINKI